MPINTLICTTGTSLFYSNLAKLNVMTKGAPVNWEPLHNHYKNGNWSELAKEMLKVEPSNRILGAEINTIEESLKKKWITPQQIVFLVSDTDAGLNTGKVLTNYFNNRRDLELRAEYCVIEDLQDTSPARFKKNGLRNLVKQIGNLVKKFGSENIAIDATGGYKAQIAIAVMLGQALRIPVYYKHELFSEIIDFPPMPVTLDYDLIGKHADLFTDLERGKTHDLKQWEDLDPRLKVFVNEVEVDGSILAELNAVGQLYLTSFRLRNPKAVNLKPLDDNQRKKPTFRDDHLPKGYVEFVNKVWSENRWIKTCYSQSYHGQAGLVGIGFKVKQTGNGQSELIGIFEDRDNFGAPFGITLSDMGKDSLTWAADQLNMMYRNH